MSGNYTFSSDERKTNRGLIKMMSPGRRNKLLSRVMVFFLLAGFAFDFAQSNGRTGHNATRVTLSEPLTIRWRYDSDRSLNLTPAFDTERIYLPLAGGIVVALRARDGQLYWRSEMGGELSAAPAADDQKVYVASETGSSENGSPRLSGALRALGREGGVTHWMTPLVVPLRGALTINGKKIFAGGSDGRIYAFDKETGGVYWSIPYVASFNCQPTVKDSRVYFGSEDGSLLAVEESTGKMIWRYRTKGAVRGPFAVVEGTVYFGSGDGYVYAVNSKGRLLWRNRTGAGVQAVTLVEQSLLVASLDNFVYLLSLNGSRIWKRQMPGRISAQPLTIEDAALFTPLTSSAGVVLALRDGRQVNSLPTGEEITTSAAPVVVGDVVLLTTMHGLLAFAQPKDTGQPKSP
jgi:outer membrane protein assembly factor BamB